jgi:hypothetical protein
MPTMHAFITETGTLSVDTFGPGIDLQPCLGHVCVFQVVQRHPHQMALDLVKPFPDILWRLESIEDVTRLYTLRRQEGIIVVKRFD